MEALGVGRLALVFFIAFAIFPKHQCSTKTTKMIKWDDEEGENLDLDFCVKGKCKDFNPCWCCRLPFRKDCYGDEATCKANCPSLPFPLPLPPPQPSPST